MMSNDLIEVIDYREFLRLWLDQKAEARGKKINYSALARKAGFSSRSFIKEVLEKKRRLTNKSIPKFLRAFDLKGREARFFECLVALEESDIDLGFKNQEQIYSEIARIKEKWRRKMNPASEDEKQLAGNQWAFKMRHVGEVYAALGDAQSGASLAEIRQRTELSAEICLEVIRFLLTRNAISQKNDRFFALNTNLDIFNLGSDESFRLQYREALLQLQRKSHQSLKSDHEFFFHSSFSVSQEKMPAFKKQLKELILEFLDDAQEDQGNKIAKLTMGMYF